MKLPLCYYGNSILRKRCEPITEVTDEIRQLAHDMIETMDANDGIGLAAPQVGKLIRIFVLRNPSFDQEGNLVLGDAQVYINPKISEHSEKHVALSEGCLSIPGIREEVDRPYSITVEALDLDGNLFTEQPEGYKARVIMHENDHINGVLFIDRIDKKIRKKLEPDLRAIKKKYHS